MTQESIDWQVVANVEMGSIHIGCGGDCNDSDGYWFCIKCLDIVENDEVVVPEK